MAWYLIFSGINNYLKTVKITLTIKFRMNSNVFKHNFAGQHTKETIFKKHLPLL